MKFYNWCIYIFQNYLVVFMGFFTTFLHLIAVNYFASHDENVLFYESFSYCAAILSLAALSTNYVYTNRYISLDQHKVKVEFSCILFQRIFLSFGLFLLSFFILGIQGPLILYILSKVISESYFNLLKAKHELSHLISTITVYTFFETVLFLSLVNKSVIISLIASSGYGIVIAILIFKKKLLLIPSYAHWRAYLKAYIKPVFALSGATIREIIAGPGLVMLATSIMHPDKFIAFNSALKFMKVINVVFMATSTYLLQRITRSLPVWHINFFVISLAILLGVTIIYGLTTYADIMHVTESLDLYDVSALFLGIFMMNILVLYQTYLFNKNRLKFFFIIDLVFVLSLLLQYMFGVLNMYVVLLIASFTVSILIVFPIVVIEAKTNNRCI